jgi:hypothetical protein
MAKKQEHRTRLNSRVRIKGDVTHMYPAARAYGEARVKGKRHDDLGYPLIFVEWDKDHWAYSGEEDGWTLEAHFDLVEDQMEEKDLVKALSDLVKKFERKEEPEEVNVENIDDPDDEPSYDEMLEAALEDARDGEGFVVFVARKEAVGDTELVVPHIYRHSRRDDAALMLDAVMADTAAQTYASLAFMIIEKAKRGSGS